MSSAPYDYLDSYSGRPARVGNGLIIARPGVVFTPTARTLVDHAEAGARSVVRSRARAYASTGQIHQLDVAVDAARITARVDGSGGRPYPVTLDRRGRWIPTCACPAFATESWCKHAVAVAYAAAAHLDTRQSDSDSAAPLATVTPLRPAVTVAAVTMPAPSPAAPQDEVPAVREPAPVTPAAAEEIPVVGRRRMARLRAAQRCLTTPRGAQRAARVAAERADGYLGAAPACL